MSLSKLIELRILEEECQDIDGRGHLPKIKLFGIPESNISKWYGEIHFKDTKMSIR